MALSATLRTAGRIANRLKREVTLRAPLRALVERRHRLALAAHAPLLPPLESADAALVRALRTQLVVQRAFADLGVRGSGAVLDALARFVQELRATPAAGRNAICLPAPRLLSAPQVYLWGLDERLLDLVENYIGLPVQYHGASVRREVADGRATDVRQWHLDPEDSRMLKIIVYLGGDVGDGGGAFEYLDGAATRRAVRALRYVSGFVDDARMRRVVPESEWRRATGAAYTANLADTCAVFHRAGPPVNADRYTVTYSWTSRRPRKTYGAMPMSESEYRAVTVVLSPRQRACVPPRIEPGPDAA